MNCNRSIGIDIGNNMEINIGNIVLRIDIGHIFRYKHICIFQGVGLGVRREVGGGSAGGSGRSEAALAADWKRGCGGRTAPPGRAGGAGGACQ